MPTPVVYDKPLNWHRYVQFILPTLLLLFAGSLFIQIVFFNETQKSQTSVQHLAASANQLAKSYESHTDAILLLLEIQTHLCGYDEHVEFCTKIQSLIPHVANLENDDAEAILQQRIADLKNTLARSERLTNEALYSAGRQAWITNILGFFTFVFAALSVGQQWYYAHAQYRRETYRYNKEVRQDYRDRWSNDDHE